MPGGTVSATEDDIYAVYNYSTGQITIEGDAKVSGANPATDRGTIYLLTANSGTAVLVINPNPTITNTAAGNLIYNPNSAVVTNNSGNSNYYSP